MLTPDFARSVATEVALEFARVTSAAVEEAAKLRAEVARLEAQGEKWRREFEDLHRRVFKQLKARGLNIDEIAQVVG